LNERDTRNYESLANNILDLDSSILAVMMINVQNGSTLVDIVRSEFRENFGSISKRSNGMAGKWGIVAFSSMDRIEPLASQARYLAFVRDSYTQILFPFSIGLEIMLAIIIDNKAEASEIFETVHSLLSGVVERAISS
jgi:hypothetical protein